MRQRTLSLMIAVLSTAGSASAQLVDEFSPPPSSCCLPRSAKTLADQLQDWNQLGRYHQANRDLMKRAADPRRVVFMGDSITDFWDLGQYFPGKPYVDRGISGQTTQQMLVRLYPDVIALKPAAMVLLAGVNDINRNTGPQTAEMVQQNIMAMAELAQQHGIKVILCALLPVSDYPFLKAGGDSQPPPLPGRAPTRRNKMTEGHPPADILKMNAWLKEYAARVNATYVDYFSALVDEKGWLRDDCSEDGLHPNAAGYKTMAALVSVAIEKALAE